MAIEAKPIGNDMWTLSDLLGRPVGTVVQTSRGFTIIEPDTDRNPLGGIDAGPHPSPTQPWLSWAVERAGGMPAGAAVRHPFGRYGGLTSPGDGPTRHPADPRYDVRFLFSHRASAMVFRKLPDELPDKARLLHAMGECRNAATDAMSKVKPFGLTHRALSLLTGAIDTVAWFFTGSTSHFHLMSMPAPEDMEPP